MARIVFNLPEFADYQERFLYNEARFTVTEASTKAGKTFPHIIYIFEQAHRTDLPIGWECWWVAPIYKQAEIAFKRLKREIERIGAENVYRINESKMYVQCPNGRMIQFKSADNPDSLYGEDVMLAVLDEFTRMDPSAFYAVRSTLTATRGKMKLIGNYISEANWGHLMAMERIDDPEWDYFKIPATEAVKAGIMSQDELDQAKKDYPRDVYLALYMCEGSAHPLQLFEASAVSDMWEDEAERGEKCIVIDVAGPGKDETVVALFDGMVLEKIRKFAKSSTADCVAAVQKWMEKFKVEEHNVVVDNGYGHAVAEAFPGCLRYDGSKGPVDGKYKLLNFGNLRAQCYYEASIAINERRLSVNPDLAKEHRKFIDMELLSIRRKHEVVETKFWIEEKKELKKRIKRSTDYADVIQMMMYRLLKPRPMMVEAMEYVAEERKKRRKSKKRRSSSGRSIFEAR